MHPTNIRELRNRHKLTIREASRRSGISEREWKTLERGLVVPDDHLLSKLKQFFEHSATNLNFDAGDAKVIGEGYVTSKDNSFQILAPSQTPLTGKLRVVDFFCGAGGLSFGFDQTTEFQTMVGTDLLSDRVATFHKNHPSAYGICGSIADLSARQIFECGGRPSVVVGGPPCQGFSSIRPFRNLTEGDQRNTLPELYLLMVAQLKPEWVVFENVVGLLSHKRGNVFHQVLSGLSDLGYFVDYKVINAAALGVPQNRERVYVVGRADGKQFDWMRPSHLTNNKSMAGANHPKLDSLPLFDQNLKSAVTVSEAISDLPEIRAGEGASTYDKTAVTEYQKKMRRSASSKLTMHHATRHSDKMMEIIRHAGKNRASLPEGMTSSGFSSCYSRLDAHEPSTTITVNFVHPSSNRCIHPSQDRALTPREGARLQGFPDNFEFLGTKSQITKQIVLKLPKQ